MTDDRTKLIQKVHELERSLHSERSKNKVNEEEIIYLRKQLKKLQEELDKAKKISQGCENQMKTKVPFEPTIEHVKDLEHEVQHLKFKNKELADRLATNERKMREITCQRDALNKEKKKLAETYRRTLQGKMKINL